MLNLKWYDLPGYKEWLVNEETKEIVGWVRPSTTVWILGNCSCIYETSLMKDYLNKEAAKKAVEKDVKGE